MANTIKLKRGTSTPTTSDIVDGEIAVDKSAQKLYLNDGGSIKEIGGGGGGSGTPLRYLHVDGSGSQALATSLATIDLSTTIITSDASDFSISSGQITVVNAGTYFVSYSLDGDQSSGNNRVIVDAEVQLNGVGVTGSQSALYSRNTADGDFTCVGSCIIEITAGQIVDVEAKKDNSSITTNIERGTSSISIFSLSGSGPAGDAGPAGPSDIPQNSQTSAYTLVAGDNGKHINITTGGVTVPSGVFSAGNVVSIYNDSGSNQTITQGGSVTLRLAGSATTGNRTLAQYGLCSVLCVGSNEFVISGAGLT